MTEFLLGVVDRAEPWALTVLCAVVVAGVEQPEYRSLICVPMETRGEVVGVLTVDAREEGFFDRDDLLIVSLYAHLLGLHLGSSLKREEGTDGWQRLAPG